MIHVCNRNTCCTILRLFTILKRGAKSIYFSSLYGLRQTSAPFLSETCLATTLPGFKASGLNRAGELLEIIPSQYKYILYIYSGGNIAIHLRTSSMEKPKGGVEDTWSEYFMLGFE